DLYLYGNQIEDIRPLSSLKNLKYLELSNNKISNVRGLSQLENLKQLIIANNELKDVKGLGSLKSLESLALSYNQINNIYEIGLLNNLKRLSASNNKIRNVKGLDRLENLMFVDISQNEISDITPLRMLDKLTLTNIDFSGNPLPKYVFEDKLNQQFILSMLSPYIVKAVEKYYGEFRQYMNGGILGIESTKDGFEIKVVIETFVGPHNPPYGLDTITFIKSNSEIKVVDFSHQGQ
ncbi:MAG: leucine-rich repeat domain-containing protein, partial [Clostridium sp.]|nr:leucine-rich repeat domain-containing protein [Clostridium sp.]